MRRACAPRPFRQSRKLRSSAECEHVAGCCRARNIACDQNGHTTHTVGVRPCHRARLWARTWRRAESCASARASASAAEPQDGPSTVLSRELEQATGSFGNADASFFAQWVDVGGGGGGGGGNDCGDGTGEDGGGGEGGSAESTRASTGLSFALGVTLDVVCSRTRSSADSRAIHTAQHTSAKMLHRGSVSRCLGLASRGLASISPSCRRAERAWRVVLARRRGVNERTRRARPNMGRLRTYSCEMQTRSPVLLMCSRAGRGPNVHRSPTHQASESPPWLRPRQPFLPSSQAGSLRRP